MKSKLLRACALLLAGLFLTPSLASSQTSGGSDGGSSDAAVVLVPHGGAYLPGVHGVGDVTSGVDSLLSGKEMTFVLGATMQFGSPDGPANFRLSGIKTTSAVVTRQSLETEGSATENFLAATGDLVLRPLPRLLIQPYGIAGAGAQKSTSTADAGANSTESSSWHAVGKVGAGVDVRIGTRGVVASAEVVDYLSGITDEREVRHDAIALVGLGIPLF